MIELNTLQEMRAYGDGISERAAHHGAMVQSVVPSLVGYVHCFADRVKAHEGRSMRHGTVAWADFGSRRVAFRFNHDTLKIEAREGTVRGRLLREFDNATSQNELHSFFTSL